MILSAWNFQNQQHRGAKPKVFNEAGKRRKVPIFDVSQVAHAGWGLSRARRAGVSSAAPVGMPRCWTRAHRLKERQSPSHCLPQLAADVYVSSLSRPLIQPNSPGALECITCRYLGKRCQRRSFIFIIGALSGAIIALFKCPTA